MATRAITAESPAHFQAMGNISTPDGATLDVPEMTLNIGGFGKGYILNAINSWDPTANSDGSFTSLALGDDIYIYAVPDTAPQATLVASKNATVPTGYTAATSRKIGGFHYGRVRPITQRYEAAFSCPVQIIPNAVWDLLNRPTCDPTGFMRLPSGVWLSIYLMSAGSGTWPTNTIQSRYNATPSTGTEGYMYKDYGTLLTNSGMRFPLWEEITDAAYGVPQGATGQGGRINTGQMTGYGFDCVSCYGMDQPSGNIWQLCGDRSGNGTGWGNNWASQGKDGQYDRGQVYGVWMSVILMGGSWGSASQAGALCSFVNTPPWDVNTGVGVRAACDAIRGA